MTPPRAPGLRLHKRTLPVHAADAELRLAAFKFQAGHDLTDVEMLQCLASVQQSYLKSLLRAERHLGDPDRKADEA